ncbi:GNAT family N-acetyltransferase [Halobaculum litoreum]|uniref:GNAT family N-acetyltransferase n=1 Tax=Halobaculum litoreum TaxID=3031998 RepID=A0ABD5XRM3_9EURY
MSPGTFEVREVTPDDGDTMKRLVESNPDGGDIQFAPRFSVDPYEMYSTLMPVDDFAGFIAEAPSGDAAGMGFIAFNDSRLGGRIRPRGYLAGLMVDHEYRGDGLGTRLATERIEYAEETVGDDVVIAAAIQSGNDASMGVARSWADGFPYEYVMHPLETRVDRPSTSHTVRTLERRELRIRRGDQLVLRRR